MADTKNLPTISFIEGFFFLSINFIADVVELLGVAIEVIPVIGWAFWAGRIFISFGVVGVTWTFLLYKGVRPAWYLAGAGLDFGINLVAFDVPFGKSVSFCVNWYKINEAAAIQRLVAKSKILESNKKRRWGKIYPSPQEDVGAGALPEAA